MKRKDIKIIRADCLEFLRRTKDKDFQFSFADPPYNVGFDYDGYSDDLAEDAYLAWCQQWFSELLRVTDGSVVITPGTKHHNMWVTQIQAPTGTIAWTKPYANSWNTLGARNGACSWEPVLVYRKSKGLVRSDWINSPMDSHDPTTHPCPKPMKLLKELILAFTFEGDTVFDPFTGSGKIAVASLTLNRCFVGTEQSRVYVAEAKAWVESELARGGFLRSIETRGVDYVQKNLTSVIS